MATYDDLDNAAQTALVSLLGASKEQIGALYRDGDRIASTGLIGGTKDDNVRGSLRVPAGSLLALVHNHPRAPVERERDIGEAFSDTDKAQARKLGVPSYIQTPSYALKRYDPKTGKTEEVLAEFPIEAFKVFLMQRLLGRAADDPRGLYK